MEELVSHNAATFSWFTRFFVSYSTN